PPSINRKYTWQFFDATDCGPEYAETWNGRNHKCSLYCWPWGWQLNTVGYNASKAAVINLTRALAVEWGSRNIRVNAIAPGMFRTRMTEAILNRAEAVVAGATPMGRIGQPGEIAPVVLFLASVGASYITGQVVPIDGGRTAQ